MLRTIGWETYEVIAIGLPNCARCRWCGAFWNYLGVLVVCPDCGRTMPDDNDILYPEITIDDFLKIDLRVGKVDEADRVPKSTKLIRMQVNFGDFKRQILAGVGETFETPDLVGKQFLFVVNLAPRKIMSLESHGMMLATGPDSKSLSLVRPDVVGEIPNGARVG